MLTWGIAVSLQPESSLFNICLFQFMFIARYMLVAEAVDVLYCVRALALWCPSLFSRSVQVAAAVGRSLGTNSRWWLWTNTGIWAASSAKCATKCSMLSTSASQCPVHPVCVCVCVFLYFIHEERLKFCRHNRLLLSQKRELYSFTDFFYHAAVSAAEQDHLDP